MEIIQLKVPQWGKYEGLLHGFMGRRGGRSIGPYAGLNMSYRVSDDPKVVSQNVCDMKLAVGIHEGRIVTMVPLLFVAPKQKLVAAVHAGWRGTLAGIAEKAVKLFNSRYGVEANELEVALGPSIGACCYEVKDDVAGPLLKRWGDIAKLSIQTGNGEMYLDLRQLNHDVLAQAGIPAKNIFQVGPCTSCSPSDFFSYRRERSETGRQISFIGWLPPCVPS